MNAQTPTRGRHLVAGGRNISATGRWIAKLFAGSFNSAVERIDRGIVNGTIHAKLPDGSARTVGGRGEGPTAHIHLKSWHALVRLATAGSIGWYEAWVAGEWDSPDPVMIFDLFMRNADTLGDTGRAKGPWRWAGRMLNIARRNSKAQARRNIAAHYDLGNDFYRLWLDETMSYSSALWDGLPDNASLAQAQANKVDRLGHRLALKPGSDVLEIGCGWGFLARRLTETSAARVTGISLSDEQSETSCSKPMPAAPISSRPISFPAAADQRTRVPQAGRRAGTGRRDRSAFGLDYAETLRLWRERFDRAVAEGRLPAGFDREFVRSVAILPDVLRRRLSWRRHRCRPGYASQARLNRFTRRLKTPLGAPAVENVVVDDGAQQLFEGAAHQPVSHQTTLACIDSKPGRVSQHDAFRDASG
jgi:hypothetical protein